MFLNRKINKLTYFGLSLVNILIGRWLIGDTTLVLILFGGIYFNQAVLVYVVSSMLEKNKSLNPFTPALVILKFFVLIGLILFAVSQVKEKTLFVMGFYIIQLIILAISNKRLH